MPEILLLFALILLASPLGTGLFAWWLGKPFWKWLAIGTLLPGISFFLLAWTLDEPSPPSPTGDG